MELNRPLTARIRIPQARKKWIERPRCIKALESSMDYRLTLITAPAGYGKTGLLSQFIQNGGQTYAWLTLSEEEQDVQNFCRALVTTLTQYFPKTQSAENFSGDANVLANALADELLGAVPAAQQVCFVLDDFHVIESSKVVIEFFNQLILLIPDNIRFIVAGRILPQLQLAQLIAEQQVSSIGVGTLKLDMDEMRRLINSISESASVLLDDATLKRLYGETEGWLVGVIMQSQVAAMQQQQLGNTDMNASNLLNDYLLKQVLNRQSANIRQVLMRSSVYPEITPQQFGTLLDNGDVAQAGKLMAEIERRNLFIQRPPNSDPRLVVYRYQSQFRMFLQQQFQIEEPAKFNELRGSVLTLEQSSHVAHTIANIDKPLTTTKQAPPLQIIVNDSAVPVQIYGFGRGKVIVNGELITTQKWGWNIPRELMYFMLNSRQSTRERIGSIFWPDANTATMQRGFHNAKLTIRNVLGTVPFTYFDGVYSVNPQLKYYYDVDEFERLMRESQKAEPQQVLMFLLKATDVYTDDFLIESTMEWAVRTRRRLHEKFQSCCLDAASVAMKLNEEDAVIRLIERAFYMDVLNEDVARVLMMLNARMGRRLAAIEIYTQLVAGLKRELNVTPDQRTEQLIQIIRSEQPVVFA
jgi:two-component SAPR family response regulator